MTKFQEELRATIMQYGEDCAKDYLQSPIDIQKLESLISRCVDEENLYCKSCKCEIEAMICEDCI